MSIRRSPGPMSPSNSHTKLSGITLGVPPVDLDRSSPAFSTFSFEPSPDTTVTVHENSMDRKDTKRQPITEPHERGDVSSIKPKARYYEEQFAYKDAAGPVRNKVNSDAPVIAELRTNVIVKDEFSLVTNLSHQLSARYQRPESSILVIVVHSACMMFGGSFDSAYVLTISALASHVKPTTNKRNAAMIQATLASLLDVPLPRGIIRFQPIEEQNLAINGKTILGEIEFLEKQHAKETGGGLKRALTKNSRTSLKSKTKSSPQLFAEDFDGAEQSPSSLAISSPLKSKKSFKAIGRKASDSGESDNGQFGLPSVAEDLSLSSSNNRARTWASGGKQSLKPPPIPEEEPAPKIGKRKSFMSVFKR